MLYLYKLLNQLPVHAIPSSCYVPVAIPGRLKVIEPCLDGLTVEHVAIMIICFSHDVVHLIVKDTVVVRESRRVVTPETVL